MPDDRPPDCRLALVVPHPERDAILTVASRRGVATWCLPTATVASGAPVRAWVDGLEALLGARPVLLRHETVASVDHDHPTLVVIEIEPMVPPSIEGRWISTGSPPIDDADPDIRSAVARFLARRADAMGSRVMPWSEPGWFDRAAAWMLDEIRASGRRPLSDPVQHYLWSIASVLRCPTTTGDVYLKATSPAFPQETAITGFLSVRTPGLTPAVIAVNATERWLLMDDHRGRPLGDEPGSAWPAGIAAHARIQRAVSADVGAMQAVGVPTRSLDDLAVAVVDLTEDDGLMRRLDDAQRSAYRAAVPRLVDACSMLDGVDVGPSLVHGDLHPHNVAVRDDSCLVFDWSDAAIGHPFIDLVPYVLHTDDPAIRRAIRDAYLAEWADVLTPRQRQDAAALALPVGCLYQVVSYIGILGALGDDVDDMADADVDWIGRTLRVLDQGIDLEESARLFGLSSTSGLDIAE